MRSCLSEAMAFNCFGFGFGQYTFLSLGHTPILPCSGGRCGDIMCCLPALIKQDFARMYTWGDMEKHRPDLLSKTDLLPSCGECGQQMATSCQLMQGQPQRYRESPGPGSHPFWGSLPPATEHSEGARPFTPNGGSHREYSHSSARAGSVCITVDFSLCPLFFLSPSFHGRPSSQTSRTPNQPGVRFQGSHPATITRVPLGVFQSISICTVST